MFAAVSHLPHLLAYALVHDVAQRDNSAQLFAFAAGGFRDFTRIAGSCPRCGATSASPTATRCWRARPLLDELDALRARSSGDGAALEQLFAEARDARATRWTRHST